MKTKNTIANELTETRTVQLADAGIVVDTAIVDTVLNPRIKLDANNSLLRLRSSRIALAGRHGLHPKDKALDGLLAEYEDRNVTIECPEDVIVITRDIGDSRETVTVAVKLVVEKMLLLYKQHLGVGFNHAEEGYFADLQLLSKGYLTEQQAEAAGESVNTQSKWDIYKDVLSPLGFTGLSKESGKGKRPWILYKNPVKKEDLPILAELGFLIQGFLSDGPESIGIKVTLPDTDKA